MASSQPFLFAPEKPLVQRLGKSFFRKIPKQAGVYKMRDAQNNILYVGKAKNLRQRLSSYRIANPERLSRRRLRLLQRVVRIEFELCTSETKALRHEARLIREIKPKFNRAGVWPGRPRFLVWRFDQQCAEFAIQETPLAGWARLGPLGSWAPRLRAALVRCLWLRLHPETGFAGLPHGWAQDELGAVAKLQCGARVTEVQVAMDGIMSIAPEGIAAWLKQELPAEISGFDRAALLADWETIREFSSHQSERNRDPAQMPLL